ncbi:hypothetical protein [Aestuariivivens sediminis]|uniref:hypothetical protein n=1 Tax=Aestuariivivens sediminis TaxID=2913557 RepID=UPI001F56DFF6|nr:hypothetical protein [Aestuariivivens sediminis]
MKNLLLKNNCRAIIIFLLSINNLFAQANKNVFNEKPAGFDYFIGIVGNPSAPNIDWSDKQLIELKQLGVNMLQLSIAWGGKPADEVLNLEDLDEEQKAKFKYRIKQAKKFGFKTIAHFGIPRMLNYAPILPACIMDEDIKKKYVDLISDFMISFPEVDDILVYTYDQQAWICSEFGPCPRCSGLPLDERLPGFLNLLNNTIQKYRPNGSRLWWKPWEISKGQTIAILEKLNTKGLGLMLNPSTTNEVYPFNDRSFKSDLGVKRFVTLARTRNIPVIGEFDHTLYKPLYQIGDYFPRLVYETLNGWKELNIQGIKEYYGFESSNFSVNYEMLKAWVKSPEESLEYLLNKIAAPYGEKRSGFMKEAWELVAQSVEAFPWDVTYLIGPMGLDLSQNGTHSWQPANIPNATWDTPIWEANRRANFMLTDSNKAHPWIFEDAGLRLEDAAKLGFLAVEFFDKAIAENGIKIEEIKEQRAIVNKTSKSLRGVSIHYLLTLASQDARMAQINDDQFQLIVKRIDKLLVRDLENGNKEAEKKLIEFRQNPKQWLQFSFNPRTHESISYPDWKVWTVPQD